MPERLFGGSQGPFWDEAGVVIRVHPRGTSLEVRVYAGKDPLSGKEHYLTQIVPGTGREARVKAKKLQVELAEKARRTKGAPRDPTLDTAIDRWLDVANLEPSTLQRTTSALDRHVRPPLGSVKLRTLKNEHLDALYTRLRAEGLAPSYVRRIHGMVRAALAQAVVWQWIDENPAATTRPISLPTPDPVSPDPMIVLAILAEAERRDPDLACFLRVAAATGMRRGEICALRRSDLALDRQMLRKTHAIGEGSRGAYEKSTKTGGRHAISLDAGTVGALIDQLGRVDERASGVQTDLIPDPYVFTWTADGSKPWGPNGVTKAFGRLRKVVPGAEKVRLHSLRHFVATTMLGMGHAPATVAGRLGHSRSSTTTDIYAAFLPTGDRVAADQIGELLSSDVDSLNAAL